MRERLLESAMALAAEQEFETCGLREIAARADVSPAMIAYYFGGRAGLVEALYQRAFERVSRRTGDFLERPEFAEREEGLGTLVRLYVAALGTEPWLPRMLASELLAHGASPLRSRLFGDLTRGPLMAMVAWLEAEQRAGRLRSDVDARWLALSVAGLCIFPFLVRPIVGDALGLGAGAAFADALVAHAEQILAEGLLVRSKEAR